MEKLLEKNKKVLLLVAHPDDETIFCGGTMLLYPDCEWTVISMTDDGRPEAFNTAIENFKKRGVNIIVHKTLGLKNVGVTSNVSDLGKEREMWKKVLKDEDLSPDIVITHGKNGEYGHGAHKLLSVAAADLFPNIVNFVYPKLEYSHQKIEIKLDERILKEKTDIFNQSYPTESYIWQALSPVMEYEFKKGPEVFSLPNSKETSMKKKILVIIPDRFVKSAGGMGANSAPLFEVLSKKYDFYVAGYPLQGTAVPSFIYSYKEVSAPFTEVQSGALNTMIGQARYLSAAISFPKPDLIFAFDWSIYLSAVEAAEFFKVPLVTRMCLSPILLSEQGYTFGLNLSLPTEKALHNSFCEMEIRGMKRADRIVQVSRGYAKLYEHIAPIFKDKTRLVINGIDLAKWQKPDIESFKLPGTGKQKVVYLGRLTDMKGVLPLCAARVPKDIDLIFIGPKETGDTACINALDQKMKTEKNVHFLGALYGDDKIRALRSADALIVPSHHEVFGGTALEGLAAGCIVLSSRFGGLSDYLNDETSIFCGTKPKDIEQAYEKLLNQTKDEKEKMQKAGFEMCKTMTLEKSATELKNVFEELLS